MARLLAAIRVEAGPQDVFHALESGLSFGADGMALIPVTSARGPGARYHLTFRRMGLPFRLETVLEQHQPDRRLVWKDISGRRVEAEAELFPEADGIRLVLRLCYRLPSPHRWLVSGAYIRAGVWRALQSIKSQAESLHAESHTAATP